MISMCDTPSSIKKEKTKAIKTLIFRLKEEENYSEFLKKLIDFVEDVDSKQLKTKRNMKEPLNNPVLKTFKYGVTSLSHNKARFVI